MTRGVSVATVLSSVTNIVQEEIKKVGSSPSVSSVMVSVSPVIVIFEDGVDKLSVEFDYMLPGLRSLAFSDMIKVVGPNVGDSPVSSSVSKSVASERDEEPCPLDVPSYPVVQTMTESHETSTETGDSLCPGNGAVYGDSVFRS